MIPIIGTTTLQHGTTTWDNGFRHSLVRQIECIPTNEQSTLPNPFAMQSMDARYAKLPPIQVLRRRQPRRPQKTRCFEFGMTKATLFNSFGMRKLSTIVFTAYGASRLPGSRRYGRVMNFTKRNDPRQNHADGEPGGKRKAPGVTGAGAMPSRPLLNMMKTSKDPKVAGGRCSDAMARKHRRIESSTGLCHFLLLAIQNEEVPKWKFLRWRSATQGSSGWPRSVICSRDRMKSSHLYDGRAQPTATQ
ncbi:unnamed protein product, partial [Nesidiocoris tenuis]